jgi:hypothetical protein
MEKLEKFTETKSIRTIAPFSPVLRGEGLEMRG